MNAKHLLDNFTSVGSMGTSTADLPPDLQACRVKRRPIKPLFKKKKPIVKTGLVSKLVGEDVGEDYRPPTKSTQWNPSQDLNAGFEFCRKLDQWAEDYVWKSDNSRLKHEVCANIKRIWEFLKKEEGFSGAEVTEESQAAVIPSTSTEISSAAVGPAAPSEEEAEKLDRASRPPDPLAILLGLGGVKKSDPALKVKEKPLSGIESGIELVKTDESIEKPSPSDSVGKNIGRIMEAYRQFS